MPAWFKKLDSMFSGLTDAVSKPASGRRRGVDRLFGEMLEQLHQPDPVSSEDDSDVLADTAPAGRVASGGSDAPNLGGRPGLDDFTEFRTYGGVVMADGDDPYEAMSPADHEVEYAE
ncbi:MAG: hypothetical protein H6981_10760 [Gammaproteobacteria bacterium]|nr:hypothetical protein [Gammaproteobacteria bacterium]MCP5137269.1 hypothetical protein [Gammaproteobacteria bacterium]